MSDLAPCKRRFAKRVATAGFLPTSVGRTFSPSVAGVAAEVVASLVGWLQYWLGRPRNCSRHLRSAFARPRRHSEDRLPRWQDLESPALGSWWTASKQLAWNTASGTSIRTSSA